MMLTMTHQLNPPTHCEMLMASSIINRFIETLDSPSAHKLETDLVALTHQIHLQSYRGHKLQVLLILQTTLIINSLYITLLPSNCWNH